MNGLKLNLAAAVCLSVAVLGIAAAVTSHIKISRLEKALDDAKENADAARLRADELEKRSYVYEEKILFLEGELVRNRQRAERLDGELEKLSAETDAARRDLDRGGSRSGKPSK